MSTDEARRSSAAKPAAGATSPLSGQDVARLTTYKRRYSLEACGFSAEQADRLIFMKWLYGQRGLSG